MKLLSRLTATEQPVERMSWDEYVYLVNQLTEGGLNQTYLPGSNAEVIATDFCGHVQQIYKRNGPIFALMAFRLAMFSQIRWVYQSFSNGRPADVWSDQTLDVLNNDAQLNKRMIQDIDLAGNFYGVREPGAVRNEAHITRLRPDWVQVLSDRPLDTYDAHVQAFAFYEGGPAGKTLDDAVLFPAQEVVHWYDQPDPEATYRGMSWLTPIVREIAGDSAATGHKLKFFENGATPNLVFKFDASTAPAAVREFKDMIAQEHTGVRNAYRNLYLGGGADVTVVGADLKQLEFSLTQGKGESRLAAAARVPAVLVGFSEGMQAATYSNFGQARRGAGDSLLYPLWTSAAAALANVVPPPAGSRLWYDARDIPFLREDAKDDADIKAQEAQMIRTLIDAGYEPDTVVAAVTAGDWSRLRHTGLYSVQLQPPGTQPAGTPPAP